MTDNQPDMPGEIWANDALNWHQYEGEKHCVRYIRSDLCAAVSDAPTPNTPGTLLNEQRTSQPEMTGSSEVDRSERVLIAPTDKERAEIIDEALSRAADIHGRYMNATKTRAVRCAINHVIKNTTAPIVSDALPCVSCGKPSDTSTPDDAEMCWKCFGEFNAAAFDEQREVIKALVEALKMCRGTSTHTATRIAIDQALALAEKAGGE